MNRTISDEHPMLFIGHGIQYQEQTMMATRVLLIPSPLSMYTVHIFDTMGHVTAMVVYQPRQIIITYKNGFQ